MLHAPLQLNFWRAMVDNERGNETDYKSHIWKNAGVFCRYLSMESEMVGENAVVRIVYKPLFDTELTVPVTYTIMPNGDMHIACTYNGVAGLPNVPAIGFMLSLQKRFEKIRWYGRGPKETYPDRKTGGKLGIYQSTVKENFTNYLRPQENGNHCDVRYFVFCSDVDTLKITCDTPLNIGASYYTPQEIECADYSVYLPKPYCVRGFINGFISGVGGDNTWGAPIHPEFLHPSDQPLSFGFTISHQ